MTNTTFNNEQIIVKLNEILFKREILETRKLKDNKLNFVHYTNANTAYKIIENEEIWLRNVRGMNDYREIDYGRSQFIDSLENPQNKTNRNNLEQLIKKIDSNKNYKDFCDVCNQYIKDIETRTYITCLSEHPSTEDNYGRLSMWRAYGHSTGIALIISPNFLDTKLDFKNNIFLTTPVIYSDKAFLDTIPEILKSFNDNNMINYFKNKGIEHFFHVLSRFAYIYIISIKHPGFAEEREWRIILSPFDKEYEQYIDKNIIQSDVKTDFGHPEKIYKIDLNKFNFISNDSSKLLKKIIIGPSENADIIKDAFIHLFNSKGISNAENLIQISDIPLR